MSNNTFNIKGNLVDVHQRNIIPALISIENGIITAIKNIDESLDSYILSGFVDAHIHIESSMVSPQAFSQAATPFGTVATVSDPHEIANVCGNEGVLYMIENAKKAALKIHFGAPSCVPATNFETAGAVLNAEAVTALLAHPDIYYLAEMMNFPGVLFKDAEIMAKIEAAKLIGKPIDGHAPSLRGKQAQQYIEAGITTDHECTILEEALDKIEFGMKILIREGSAAKNFEALHPLFATHPESLMLCSDDKHPDELVQGHINQLVLRAINLGYDMFDVLYAACVAPVLHYKLPVGLLRVGDSADFIVVKDCKAFEVLQTYINGACVAENGVSKETFFAPELINNFNCKPILANDLELPYPNGESVLVKAIVAIDGQIVTASEPIELPVVDQKIQTDISKDILKIVVYNRYQTAKPAIGFIKNFGLKTGAIASSVAHDSHNIVAVGVEDNAIAKAINAIVENSGGISVSNNSEILVMPLPIAGLMTNLSVKDAALHYQSLDRAAKDLGSTLKAPFMTLSFMALPVIPSLKITDKGIFDVDSFNFTALVQS